MCPEPQNVSRRAVAAGAAWSVPALIISTHAPAYAASPEQLTGCFDVPLSGVTRSGVQGYSGSLTGTGVATTGTGALSYTISQSRTSGVPQGPGTNGTSGEAAPTPSKGDFSIQSGSNLGGGVYMYGGTSAQHWGSTTATPLLNNASGNLLVLNQASAEGAVKPSQTVTFDFGGQVPTSISFAIFDLTYVNPPSGAYIDSVSFSADATVTPVSGNRSLTASGDVAAGTAVAPTTQYPSPSSGVSRIDVTAAPSTSTFSLTYSNTTADTRQNLRYQQSQYIAIGDIEVCF